MAAHAVDALTVGDEASDALVTDRIIKQHHNASARTEWAGPDWGQCGRNAYTGGTCHVHGCYADRGGTYCSFSGYCYCKSGYCVKDTYSNNGDSGAYCRETCKHWFDNGQNCDDSEVRAPDNIICTGEGSCSKAKCCLPRAKCDEMCSEDEVKLPGATLCKDTTCQESEHKTCCGPKATCDANVCNNKSQIETNPGAQCAGLSCNNNECCANRGVCQASMCDTGKYIRAPKPTFCKGTECEFEECCTPRAQCPRNVNASSSICFQTQVLSPSAEYCAKTFCENSECCVDKAWCDKGQCDPESTIPVKNATMCDSDTCQESECCIPKGKCKEFECYDHTVPKSQAPAFCKGQLCSSKECCELEDETLEYARELWIDAFTDNHNSTVAASSH